MAVGHLVDAALVRAVIRALLHADVVGTPLKNDGILDGVDFIKPGGRAGGPVGGVVQHGNGVVRRPVGGMRPEQPLIVVVAVALAAQLAGAVVVGVAPTIHQFAGGVVDDVHFAQSAGR